MSRAALALGACACALLLPGAGNNDVKQNSALDRAGQAAEPRLMTYWEAKAAGFHVPPLPSETGIRACTESDYHPGFTSAEAAEQAAREYEANWGEQGPGYCQVDPRTMTFAIMPGRPGLLGSP